MPGIGLLRKEDYDIAFFWKESYRLARRVCVNAAAQSVRAAGLFPEAHLVLVQASIFLANV
jgi:hypothetical protein